MSSWTAASSDCSRPVNIYVHVKTADLYRPNARLTPERQGYQVLTPFGKLGYSQKFRQVQRRICELSDPVQTAVERLQPYHRSHPDLPPLLPLVRNLDNANKHRLVQLAVAQLAVGYLAVPNDAGETIDSHIHTGEVVDGTEIVSITVNRPTPEMDYRFTPKIIVTLPLHHTPGPCEHSWSHASFLLRELLAEVTHVITSVTEAAAQDV